MLLIPSIESFPTKVTGVWHSFVYEPMLTNRSFCLTGVVAVRTIVMNISVNLHMRIEMTFDIELLPTDFTFMRIITSVEPRVDIKITSVCEALLTERAFEFTSNVQLHMYLQGVTILKLPATNLALLLIDWRVISNVFS